MGDLILYLGCLFFVTYEFTRLLYPRVQMSTISSLVYYAWIFVVAFNGHPIILILAVSPYVLDKNDKIESRVDSLVSLVILIYTCFKLA